MHRIAIAAALSLFAAATAFRDRLKALQADAAAQRQKLGLDGDREKLYAQYPTPEISLEGDAAALPCGGSAGVKITGTFPKGTAFLVSDDEVQIADARAGAQGWQATLRASPAAAPREVNLHAVAPVSGAERSVRVAKVTGDYQLDLRFDDGWTAHFAGDSLTWKKGSEQRTTRAELDGMRLRWQRSQEEIDAQNAAIAKMRSPEAQAPMQAAIQRMQDCFKKPQSEQQACMQAANAEMEALGKKMQAMQEAAEKSLPTAAWACSEAQLQSQAGAITGTATCPPHDRRMKITGTLTCAARSGE